MDTHQLIMSEAVVVPILAFLTILFCIPPFIWHVKNRNLAASSLVFWIVLSNLFNFVNSLIWTDDDLGSWWRGYVLCDIEVKLMNAANIGVPASVVAIMRSLALVLDTDRTVLRPTPAQRKRKLALDILLCFGAPAYMVLVHYFVQDIRYYIFAISGCVPGFDNSWPSIALVHIWSPFFSLVDVYYSILVLIRVRKYRREFAAILHASNSGLTKSRFQRLVLMCIVLTVLGLPVQFYVLYKNCLFPLKTYSWSRIHGPSWWNIILIPTVGSVTFDRWIQLAVGITVFVFFGLGNDAMSMYRRWLVKLGFGKLFPTLHQRTQTSDRRPPTGSETGSFSSRAFTFVKGTIARVSSASSAHSRKPSSLSNSPLTPSPKPDQTPFQPLTIPEDGIWPCPSATEKISSNSSTTADAPTRNENDNFHDNAPAIPEPAHSRLARFLANTHVSGPFSGVRALSLFSSGGHGQVARPKGEMQAAEMREGVTQARDFGG